MQKMILLNILKWELSGKGSKLSKLKSLCSSHLRFISHSTANHVKADALSDGKISVCLDFKYVKTKIGFKSTLNNDLK